MPRILILAVLALVAAACGGTSSAPLTGSLPGSDHVHALRAADDGSLLLGLHGALWESEDGEQWEQLGLEGLDAMALGVAAEGRPLLVGGHDVLARSTDGGETFEMLSPELPSLDVHALAQAPSEPSIVYAYVVGAGIFRSEDAGDSWSLVAAVGEQVPADISAMAVDPDDSGVVLVGSGGHGVLRSTDGGQTFSQTSAQGTFGLAVGVDDTVLAATHRGVDVSEDDGQTWSSAASADQFDGQPLGVAIGPDGTWWVITEQSRVLYQSTGGGFDEVARA